MTSGRLSDEGRVRILGLDPSLTSFGIARVTTNVRDLQASSFRIETEVLKPKARGTQRLAWFEAELGHRLESWHPDLVVIEGYAYAKGNNAHQIGELGGVLRLLLYRREISPVVVAPAKLKKFITGKGNVGKEQVMMDLYKRFGVSTPNLDESDAASLALMGAVGAYGLKVSLPKNNREALKGVFTSD